MWRASQAQVLLLEHMIIVALADEVQDRECWTSERITRQKKLIMVVVVGKKYREVHSPRGKAALQQRRRAEAGNFGKTGSTFWADGYDGCFLLEFASWS